MPQMQQRALSATPKTRWVKNCETARQLIALMCVFESARHRWKASVAAAETARTPGRKQPAAHPDLIAPRAPMATRSLKSPAATLF